MKPSEEKFTAWVDEKLTGDELTEFEKLLAGDPEAAADKEEARRLGDLLRKYSDAPEMRNPDFFNHELMQRIAAEAPQAAESKGRGGFWSFWSLPRLAWAGAFGLAMAFGAYKAIVPVGAPVGPDSKYFAQVVESWPADPSISATTVYSKDDDVTVVWLDGLDYIPATIALN